jgi:hypothetical protein
MAAQYPSGTNTFVPQFDASGQLVVAFSRNPKDFPLNQYVTITPVKKGQGYFLKITPEQAARILNTDLSENVWHDGNDAPNMSWGNESFQFVKYETERYAYGFRMGWKTTEQADWKIVASHAAISAQRAMTGRAYVAITTLTTTSNYSASHFGTATSVGGGKWNAGTVAAPYIKKTILAALKVINQDTLGVVGPRDIILVVNPTLASAMTSSQEIQSLLSNSPFAMEVLKGDEIKAGRWGLPPFLYGVQVVVDDTVVITSAKLATESIGYALADTTALLVARPGGITSPEGSVSFSTGHFFVYEEMSVETRDDPDNRRTTGRVIDDWNFSIVAPSSGFVVTSCT